jgi:hypothetical protein
MNGYSFYQKVFNKPYQLTLYKNAFYRAVSKIDNLYGYNVHISCAQLLGTDPLRDYDKEFPVVAFSHFDDAMILFELVEIEPDIVSVQPKYHQPGTGVASCLDDSLVTIRRMFVYKTVDEKQYLQAKALAEYLDVALITLPFSSVTALENVTKVDVHLETIGYSNVQYKA